MASETRPGSFGIMWLLLLAFIIGVNGWLQTGCLVPYLTAVEPEYLLLLKPVSSLARWYIGSLAVLAGLHVLCARRVLGVTRWSAAFEWPVVRYLSPLVLLTLPPISVAMLATRLRPYAAPWLYVSVDLFWWLLLTIVVLVAVELDRASGHRHSARWIGRLETAVAPARSPRLFDVSLAGVLLTSSLLASPPLRFQSVVIGDEPKYLRYLENWYRGRGMDVADLGPIAALPPQFSPDVSGNFRRLGTALAHVGADLAADGRRAVGLPAPSRPGPATSQGGWFVEGKRAGLYQVHNPGISFLLFPGYVVDRLVSRTQVWHPQFPTDLYGTSAIVLLLYVLWGRAVFRLLWSYTDRPVLSWVLTCVVFLCVPATAFAYQYYPEVAAGLLIALLFRYSVLSDDVRSTPAIGYGVLAGFLPWLHLRFAPLTLAAAVAVAATRRDRPTVGWFAAGVGIPLLALGVYDYHVTGSMMPWALYALMPDESLFSAARAWRDLPAFWFDRTWGLVAHAPIYLVALPGLWWSWRRNKSVTLASGVAILAIAIPAAGHGYTGAFTTPTRLIAAVVPLLALPLADLTLAFGLSPVLKTSLAFLGLLSIQNGLTYNVHLIKSEASLQAATIGGWLFPLLLPDFDAATNRLAQPLTLLWLVVTTGFVLLPVALSRISARPRQATRRPAWAVLAAATLLAFATTSSIVAALTGARIRPAFMLKPGDARDRVIHFELTGNPAVRWSSTNGSVDVKTYFPNPEGTSVTLGVHPENPGVRDPVELSIDIRRPGNRPGWGTAAVDFGDGSLPVRVPIEGSARQLHAYTRPGEYHLRVEIELWGLPSRALVERFRVGER